MCKSWILIIITKKQRLTQRWIVLFITLMHNCNGVFFPMSVDPIGGHRFRIGRCYFELLPHEEGSHPKFIAYFQMLGIFFRQKSEYEKDLEHIVFRVCLILLTQVSSGAISSGQKSENGSTVGTPSGFAENV